MFWEFWSITFSTDPYPARSKTKSCEHLGRVLQQNLSIEADSRNARGSFMSRVSYIRDHLWFSDGVQKTKAIILLFVQMPMVQCSGTSNSFYRAWNIQARLDTQSESQQVLSRYPTFLQKLEASNMKEVLTKW